MSQNALPRIGFVGVGMMGAAMLRRVLDSGYEVAVYDVRREALEDFADHPRMSVASSARDVAVDAEIVEVVVLDDAQVREVVLGPEGLLAGASRGCIVLIHSTIEPRTVVDVASAASKAGVVVLDAAISGARAQHSATDGQLCVMVGGERESFEKVLPLLRTYGDPVEHLGSLGAGMAAKLARNLTAYLSFLAHYEGLRLAEEVGVERKTMERILEATGLRSGTLAAFHEARPSMRPHDPQTEPEDHARVVGVAAMGRKDLGAALAFARERGVELPSARHAVGRMDAVFGARGETGDQNRLLLERFFPAMFADDRDTLRELLSEDIVWHVPPFAAERFGDVSGAAAVIEFLCSGGEEFFEPGSMALRPELDVVEGDEGVTLGWMTGRTAKGGDYQNRYAFGFRFRDGRICEVWELQDSLHLQAQME